MRTRYFHSDDSATAEVSKCQRRAKRTVGRELPSLCTVMSSRNDRLRIVGMTPRVAKLTLRNSRNALGSKSLSTTYVSCPSFLVAIPPSD